MTELEKYKKAFELACEYDWNSDYFGCHLPCKTDDCWGKQSCMECTQKYLLQQAEQSDTKPMTNRQWLESLSDEELARTFIRFVNRANALCEMCEYRHEDCESYKKARTCTSGIAEWLQAEHIGQSDDDIKARIEELQAQNEKSMFLLKASKVLPPEVMIELYKHF